MALFLPMRQKNAEKPVWWLKNEITLQEIFIAKMWKGFRYIDTVPIFSIHRIKKYGNM